MDFDKSFSMNCTLCNSKINMTPITCHNCPHKFCDIACAKLYNDNFEKININIKEYNMYYINNQLSNKAKQLYEYTHHTIFHMLPIYRIDNISSHDINIVKHEYALILKQLSKYV